MPQNGCDLCDLEKRTTWYYEDDSVVVINCETCAVPMVVLKRHTMSPSSQELMVMNHLLGMVADKVLGPGNWRIDKQQRQIEEHIHWHARRK